MAAKQEQIEPGIYRRRGPQGDRYIARYWADGRRYAETRRTLKEARQVKREREVAKDKGELERVVEAKQQFEEFAEAWVCRYRGNGRRGFSEVTREEYRRDLRRYAYPFLGKRKLSSISPRDISEWQNWICDEKIQGERRFKEAVERARAKGGKPPKGPAKPYRLSDQSVRRIVAAARSCLASARREGLIRSNPADAIPLPLRPVIEEGEKKQPAKAMTREQLAMVLRVAPNEWRLLLEVLASTALRWSELAALTWKDLRLDGSDPHVRVRRALVKGAAPDAPRFKVPKSRTSVRDVPLDAGLVLKLRASRTETEFAGDDDLVFHRPGGLPLWRESFSRSVLAPLGEEAGVPWLTTKVFRHTAASLLIAQGRNVKQIQEFLGHSSPVVTLQVYSHLLDEKVGGALGLEAELGRKSDLRPEGSSVHRSEPESDSPEALERAVYGTQPDPAGVPA